MAYLQTHFFSEVLGLSVQADVLLPQPASARQIGVSAPPARDRHPTLFLLHGLSDDHSIWMRRTSIERYASEHGLAVVMPAADRSFYADMVHGNRYWTYVSEELPALMRSFFPLSDRREDTFVAGLSMGGYGAFKWALDKPGTVAAAASLSGALDVASEFDTEMGPELRTIFGSVDELRTGGNDLLDLVARADLSTAPALYQWCGTEDFLYDQNVRFRDRALARGLRLAYTEGPGEHEWSCWDDQIRRVLDWLPIPR
ncbi:alpha/beta hydrolase [Cellulomonas sp.]|uniref:alpha/beta hydrolase n=1 Tax=Cellulomonas sp. TaxID=40001 RepID=UPI003BA88183